MHDPHEDPGTESVEALLEHQASRRKFFKALTGLGILSALPAGGLLLPRKAMASVPNKGIFEGSEAYQIFHNACPRNCYDTCSIVSYVKDGVLNLDWSDELIAQTCLTHAGEIRHEATRKLVEGGAA